MEKYLFWAVFFVAYTMQAVTGFAGNIFAMPVGASTIGMSTAISVLNITGFFCCGVVAVANIKHVAWREFIRIIVVMIAFMLVGIWIDTLLSVDSLLKIFGVIVFAVGMQNIIMKKRPLLPEWALWVVLVLAGIVQGMFISGGAFLVIYALQKILDKEEFRATLSLVWMVLNGLYAAIAIAGGGISAEATSIVAVCIPLGLVSVVLGQWIERRISQEVFMKLTYWMLVGIGVVLIFR